MLGSAVLPSNTSTATGHRGCTASRTRFGACRAGRRASSHAWPVDSIALQSKWKSGRRAPARRRSSGVGQTLLDGALALAASPWRRRRRRSRCRASRRGTRARARWRVDARSGWRRGCVRRTAATWPSSTPVSKRSATAVPPLSRSILRPPREATSTSWRGCVYGPCRPRDRIPAGWRAGSVGWGRTRCTWLLMLVMYSGLVK